MTSGIACWPIWVKKHNCECGGVRSGWPGGFAVRPTAWAHQTRAPSLCHTRSGARDRGVAREVLGRACTHGTMGRGRRTRASRCATACHAYLACARMCVRVCARARVCGCVGVPVDGVWAAPRARGRVYAVCVRVHLSVCVCVCGGVHACVCMCVAELVCARARLLGTHGRRQRGRKVRRTADNVRLCANQRRTDAARTHAHALAHACGRSGAAGGGAAAAPPWGPVTRCGAAPVRGPCRPLHPLAPRGSLAHTQSTGRSRVARARALERRRPCARARTPWRQLASRWRAPPATPRPPPRC